MTQPTTTDAPRKLLPVPPLEQTLERTRAAIEPLVDAAELARVDEVVDRFATGEGPEVQAELERFAAVEADAGRSWLSAGWFEMYLAVREPLPLTTSVAIDVAWGEDVTPATGIERAADVVHRLAAVHLRYLRGELDPELGFTGEPMPDHQRRYLAGGLREPRPAVDTFRPGSTDPANREIGVVHDGRLFFTAISDADGRPRSRAAITADLERITAAEPADAPSPLTPSYLGSGTLAPILEELLADDANRAAYARLADTLFLATLVDEAAENDEHLRRANVDVDQAWAYKPASYQIGLADDFLGVHMEHSTYDAGASITILTAAKAVEPDSDAADASAADDGAAGPVELAWRIPDALGERIAVAADAYRARAAHDHVRLVRAPVGEAPRAKMSADALQQFVMLTAQLRVHGRVRSTYEAVDMREYQAGRTECIRPNTSEAVALAHALLDGTATPEHLRAALDAQRARVKAAKSGQAIDRHLFGLEHAASRLGLDPAFFRDPAVRLLRTDFLSTTSLGARDPIRRIAFPAVVPDGVGFYYAAAPDAYEFLLNWRDDRYPEADELAEALVEATALVRDLARRVEA